MLFAKLALGDWKLINMITKKYPNIKRQQI